LANDRADWRLLLHPRFMEILSDLKQHVEKLSQKDPAGYQKHPVFKRLEFISKSRKEILNDPLHKKFLLGNALGEKYSHWRRAKKLRYRMFFQAHSPDMMVILCWLNDETTLRKEGSRTDAYNVFRNMLNKGYIPDAFDQLKKQAEKTQQSSDLQ
jgi:toxin YhaV